MNSARWRRVEELFYAALEQPAADRAVFLARACGRDSELLDEVRALLAAGDESGLIGKVVASGLDLEIAEHQGVPDRFGPYKTLGEIGRGGLGTVYLAERDDEHYSQRVAIKLVRRGLDTDDILARLRQERQILARLEHPNITRLLDGGSTADGQPYLVMEYVEGTALDVFADKHRLSVERRIELLLEVCSAVAWAHRNLVIHRDLKPGNVLVTAESTVKLLDFGIAKLLDHEADIEPTVPEQRLLTPEYASPEQLAGHPLSTATDIYSLGATLYRLLSGKSPNSRSSEGVRAPSGPPRPLSQSLENSDLQRAATLRSTTPTRLRRRLRGDLDNILRKAMAIEPRERYGSVTELADDLRAFLEGRPVRARAPGLVLRTWKLMGRHPWGTLALAIIVTSVLLGLTATTWQSRKARRAQAEAERISTFLTELIETSTPEVSKGETVSVRSVLDRGAERIDEELADDPEIQSRLMTTMGRAFFSLGAYDRAADLHREALEVRRRCFGKRHPTTAESGAHLAESLIYLGELDEAERLLSSVLPVQRASLGPDHPDVAESLSHLGALYRRAHRYEEAERVWLEALEITRRRLGDAHTLTSGLINNLGVVYHLTGRFDKAEHHYRQAVSIRRPLLGEDHPDYLASLGNLGRILIQRGRLEEAREHLETVLSGNRRLLGDRHREVALTLNSLGKISEVQDQPQKAVEHYREAAGILAEVVGEQHREVATITTNLGEALLETGSTAEAERCFERSLAVHAKLNEHPEHARALMGLGDLLCHTRDPSTGEKLLRRALSMRHRLHAERADDHWQIADAQARLAACLLIRERPLEASPLLTEAHAEMSRRFGPQNPRSKAVEALLASVDPG